MTDAEKAARITASFMDELKTMPFTYRGPATSVAIKVLEGHDPAFNRGDFLDAVKVREAELGPLTNMGRAKR